MLPGVNLTPKNVESGVEHMSFAEEARRAAESAAKQSTKKDNKQ
jgi:hypothetical protein